jgi:hypothetical protein
MFYTAKYCNIFQMMRAYLTVGGSVVQRARVRQSLNRVDPPAAAKRWSKTVKRRVYNVPTPNSLWHMDAHMKLVRYTHTHTPR